MVLDRKAAFVDLGSGAVERIPISPELRKRFLGGRGMNMHFLSRSYTRDLDPFSPDNPLLFGAGLLTGTLGFGSRVNITAKSPESGHLGDSNMGGDFGAEMVKAGISHLVIKGRSNAPVYLFLHDRGIEIRDAGYLKGRDTVETQRMIRRELEDEKIQIACIGPAGENRVRFACVRSGLKSAAGRTGMGAVMGAKNLKAVAVRGHRDIEIAEPVKYLTYYQRCLKTLMETKWAVALGRQGTPLLFRTANALGFLSVRNNQFTSVGEQGHPLEAEALDRYSTGMVSCFGCPVHCRHRYRIEGGGTGVARGEGPEYASIGSFGTKLGNLDLENIIHVVELCNRYGLDTISTGSYIAWAMELYQRGVMDEKTAERPLHWGDGERIAELIRQIAFREGLGDLLAEGPYARDSLGDPSGEYLMEIKNFPIEMTDERLPKSFALGMATSTRGACHMRSRPSLDVLGLPEEVLRRVYGGPVSSELTSYRGKGRVVWWHERLNAVCDSLGFCRFQTVFSSPHAPQYRQFSRLIALASGLSIPTRELRTVGERVCTLERMLLAREGCTRRDDTLPRRYFDEPIPEGPAKGAFISRTGFQGMLDEYYALHGWDREGVPCGRTLKRLGLRDENQG
ncbi:MAG: aldehyde ferredoxin oxidoreductase family protein [Deltaproteobacteria bacterium]|nr:aldehyde ferredoxin oxidoreductase family protein [Deltaproteobacteria bacterium]